MLKKKWVRWLLALGVFLFVVVPVTLLLIAWIFIDPIGKKLIETGGSSALGVKTEVGNFHCSLLNGSVAIRAMTVDNPTGFDPAKKTLDLGEVATGLSIGSLTSDTVEIQEMTIDGLKLYLEANEKTTNVETLLKNVQGEGGGSRLSGEPAPAGETPAATGPEKRFKIAKIRLANIGMELKTTWPVESKNSFVIPAFEMTDLWHKSGQGYTAGELLVEILNRTTKAGLDVGGKDLQAAIKERLLAEVNKAGAKLQREAETAVQQAADDLKKDAANTLQNNLENALSGDNKNPAVGSDTETEKNLKNDLNKLKKPFK